MTANGARCSVLYSPANVLFANLGLVANAFAEDFFDPL